MCNFSLGYIHTLSSKQLGNENTQTYRVEVFILIQQEILFTGL